MSRVIATEFVSLDGVMEDPGGSEDFEHGGWSFKFERGEEGDQFKLDETMQSDALLLGRVTYQGFAEAWPSRTGEFADKFNSMPKFVVSTTLEEAEWSNSIVIHGSAQLVRTLLEDDLIDEYRLMVFPIVLGSGKRLFGDTGKAATLKLVDSKTVGAGVLILTYQPA